MKKKKKKKKKRHTSIMLASKMLEVWIGGNCSSSQSSGLVSALLSLLSKLEPEEPKGGRQRGVG